LRDEIRAAVGADTALGWLFAWRTDAATAKLHRDLRRYFPHQSEWLEGMARAAGVPQRALIRALAASAGPEAPPAAALGASSEVGTRVACPVPPRAALRIVRPEGRFASVELALPAATAPLAGVNEAGLAVAVVPRTYLPGRVAPPPTLFARDCLERFETVEPALEWCLSRPAAAGGALLLADACGELVRVDASIPHRQPIVSAAHWLALGITGTEPPAWVKRGDLADAEELESALAATLASEAPPGGASLLVDPIGRRLRMTGGDWIPVSAAPAER
jgi:hypothetical protein